MGVEGRHVHKLADPTFPSKLGQLSGSINVHLVKGKVLGLIVPAHQVVYDVRVAKGGVHLRVIAQVTPLDDGKGTVGVHVHRDAR